MEKSILEMVGGIKYINHHYDIKAESSSCYNINEDFTGIEVNGVRFSDIGEMLRYMNKQREQLIKAKEIIRKYYEYNPSCKYSYEDTDKEAEQFLKEVDK